MSLCVVPKILGSSRLKKSSLSDHFAVPEGAYMFTIVILSYSATIALPYGSIAILDNATPSRATIAVPLLVVPVLKYVRECVDLRSIGFVTSCSNITSMP
jgi:hypothetical protein